MTASEGVVTASSLKERLQEKLMELDNYRKLGIESNKELELEKEKKRQVLKMGPGDSQWITHQINLVRFDVSWGGGWGGRNANDSDR